jgi:sarcosine oxidase subunit gamma
MSEPVTALNGAICSDGIAEVAEVPLQGMITLRGDLGSAAVKKAVGGAVPDAGHAKINGLSGVAWMSPDEVLVLCPYEEVSRKLAEMHKALEGAHALAVDVSDARASFRVTGPAAREVLAKLCPVDLSKTAFTEGMFRRTRMAQVPAAMWLSGADSLQIVCFRSQARYVFDLLCTAAQPGSDVGLAALR